MGPDAKLPNCSRRAKRRALESEWARSWSLKSRVSYASDRLRYQVEHIIREDLNMEAMEILELYCELLLARFGLLETMK